MMTPEEWGEDAERQRNDAACASEPDDDAEPLTHLVSVGRAYALSVATVCEVLAPLAEQIVDAVEATTCPDCQRIAAENGERAR
jgi:hypothetical protein